MRTTQFLICVVVMGGLAASASALMHDGFPDPSLPPVHPDPDIAYYGHDLHAMYPQDVILSEVVHKDFTNVQRDQVGADEREVFDSVLLGIVSVPSMGIFDTPVTLTGPVETMVRNYQTGWTGVFETEIVSMSLTGNIGPVAVEIREDPSLQSLGQTEIVDIGGGLYAIDSFFDVFTELSVDGGVWMADLNSPAHMELCPEPATLGLLGLGGLALLKRKRN